MSSKKPTENKIDKVLWKLVNPILKLAVPVYNLLYPYDVTSHFYPGNHKCYCGSGEWHRSCCKETNRQKGLRAFKVTKTHKKSQTKKVTIKLVKTNKSFLKSFKPGTINPINRNGGFKGSGIGADADPGAGYDTD